jgi:hypothetical protein
MWCGGGAGTEEESVPGWDDEMRWFCRQLLGITE